MSSTRTFSNASSPVADAKYYLKRKRGNSDESRQAAKRARFEKKLEKEIEAQLIEEYREEEVAEAYRLVKRLRNENKQLKSVIRQIVPLINPGEYRLAPDSEDESVDEAKDTPQFFAAASSDESASDSESQDFGSDSVDSDDVSSDNDIQVPAGNDDESSSDDQYRYYESDSSDVDYSDDDSEDSVVGRPFIYYPTDDSQDDSEDDDDVMDDSVDYGTTGPLVESESSSDESDAW